MAEGGSLVWESDEEGEQAWERLPQWRANRSSTKHSRLHAARLRHRQKSTTRDLQLRMQGNAFLGAFFAVSSLLNEFSITQEQYRELSTTNM